MNYSTTKLVMFAAAAALAGSSAATAETHKRASAPIVITPPAVPDGGNFSRAPFPAARWQNDVTPPDGQAIQQDMPPNTPSTTPAPVPPPVPTVAILQPKTEPGLMPTGHATVSASAEMAPAQVETGIRNASFDSRDDLIDGIRLRMRNAETTMVDFRRTEKDMSPQGRSQFDTLKDTVKERQKALEHSIRAAERASSADWDQARAQLASDYQAYVTALAQVDAAVGVAPARS